MCKNQWYQIQLFKKGKIEIFQNVFWHKTFNYENGKIGMVIHHSSIQNTGLYTVSDRNISECYDTKIIDTPDYKPKGDFPKDIEIILHSTRKEDKDV